MKLRFLKINSVFFSVSLRSLALFKSNERSEDYYIGLADFFVFFSGKRLKILMHLGIMHFLSSIEIHLLKVT